MKTRRKRFEPGLARVYPLPQRDPMRSLADWGAPPDPPIEPDYPGAHERPWDSPGRPPWIEPERKAPTPWWAALCIAAGVVLIVVSLVATFVG